MLLVKSIIVDTKFYPPNIDAKILDHTNESHLPYRISSPSWTKKEEKN